MAGILNIINRDVIRYVLFRHIFSVVACVVIGGLKLYFLKLIHKNVRNLIYQEHVDNFTIMC